MIGAWQAQAVQVVLFEAQSSSKPDVLRPWLEIIGSAPEVLLPGPPGEPPASTARGEVGGVEVAFEALQGRFNIVVRKPTPPNELPGLIADVPTVLRMAVDFGKQLLRSREVNRIGCILHLAQEAPSAEAARELTRSAMPAVDVPADATDVQLTYNVRQLSKVVSGLLLNRLCAWSTLQRQLMQVGMLDGGAPVHFPSVQAYTAVFVIDVNTVPRRDSFEPNTAAMLLEELAQQGSCIAAEGRPIHA